MKILRKIIIINILVCVLVGCLSLNKFESNAIDLKSINSDASNFINQGSSGATNLSGVTNGIVNNFTGLGQILTFIGAGTMVAVVTFMGIKYLTATPDKQAALKQQLIGVVVAGIVIFGAYGIWSAVITAFNGI